MATRFELVLYGDDPVRLRAAGEEALAEIERLEDQLSLYRPTSEISLLNARAAREPVHVSPTLFSLLLHAKNLSEQTDGSFDITIAPLVRCWGFIGGTGRMPGPDQIEAARACVGMGLVELRPDEGSVRFAREGVMLDLGAIGKGYAVARAAEILREAGVASALLHGGTSTAYALGHPPGSDSWKVSIEQPPPGTGAPAHTLGPVGLRDEAMSVSAVWGRSFQFEGKTLGHVLDPRTGYPVTRALMSVVVVPSPTDSDALSTALLTLGAVGHDRIATLRPGMRTALMLGRDSNYRVESRGLDQLW